MMGKPSPIPERHCLIAARRVLVKVGSAVLSSPTGLDLPRIESLAAEVAGLRAQGRSVLLVSSGAIAAGVRRLALDGPPRNIPEKQACAAVGQGALMQAWEEALRRHGLIAAQVLLTADDLNHRHRYLNARHTLETLLTWGAVPVINENDTVVVEEIKFGDNDQLAALIGVLVAVDALVILSDVSALFDQDPQRQSARPIPLVRKVDGEVLSLAGAGTSAVGTGGMRSKLLAAQKCTAVGIPVVIASGRADHVLGRVFQGEEIGTLFLGRPRRPGGHKSLLAHLARTAGEIVVDAGAADALRHHGTSLLPVGVRAVRGHFGPGAAVRCLEEDGTVVGVGLVNYSAVEIDRIRGCQTGEIEDRLGYRHSDEVIHRNHFALVGESAPVR